MKMPAKKKMELRETTQQWLAATSLHGYSYVQESRIYFFERIMWFLVTTVFTFVGLWLVVIAFTDWGQHPVATTIDTVSKELTQKENFPTVVICPKQSKYYVDEWGVVKAALALIHHTCNEPMKPVSNCTGYLDLTEQLRYKSLEKLSPKGDYNDLQLVHMVMMAYQLAEDDEEYQASLIVLIARIFGQEKLSPMGLMRVLVTNKGTKMLHEPFVKMLLDEKCNHDEVDKYVNSFGVSNSPCAVTNGSRSPCCQFFGMKLSEVTELAFLSFHYGVPLYIQDHKPLAKYLGLPYDHESFEGKMAMNHMVLECVLPHETENKGCLVPPQGFDILWTPQGYCVTFNEKAPSQIYKESDWLKAANSVLRSDRASWEEGPWLINGAGYEFAFRASVSTFGMNFMFPYFEQKGAGNWKVIITSHGSGFDNNWRSSKIEPGTENIFMETLTYYLGIESNLKDIEIPKRDCKFPYEIEGLKVFKRYSKDACDLEHMLEHAAEKCGYCIPWNLPFAELIIPKNVPRRFCDAWEAECHSKAMTDITYQMEIRNKSRCYPSCSFNRQTEDTYQKPSLARIEGRCAGQGETLFDITKRWLKLTGIEQVIKAMQANQLKSQLEYNGNISLNDDDIVQLCNAVGRNDMTLLQVKIANDKAVAYKKDLRVTLSEKIAAFGGTMGLFTGMSLLSLFEIVFWIWKCLQRVC